MRRFLDAPDELLWAYLELRERLAQPASRSPVADSGRVYARHCSQCDAPAVEALLEERSDRKSTYVYRCRACQALWPVDTAFLLKSEVQMPRSNGAVVVWRNLALYERVLASLPLDEQRAYLLLYLYEGVGSYTDVAAEMRRRWPTSVPPSGRAGPRVRGWTEWAVRQAVNSARRKIRTSAMAHADRE